MEDNIKYLWLSGGSSISQEDGALIYCYRLQKKCGKVMFLHLSVSHSVQGGGGVYRRVQWGGCTSPLTQTPPPLGH